MINWKNALDGYKGKLGSIQQFDFNDGAEFKYSKTNRPHFYNVNEIMIMTFFSQETSMIYKVL